MACLIAAFFAVEYTTSLDSIKSTINPQGSVTYESKFAIASAETINSLRDIFRGEYNANSNSSNYNQINTDLSFSVVNVGGTNGVLSYIIKSASIGSITVMFLSAVNSIAHVSNAAAVVFIILSLLAVIAIWVFFINIYRASYKRIFLEGRLYGKVPISSFFYFVRVKKLIKASLTMLLTEIYKFLWALTIVGGIIKNYSYFLVPYIVAENPDISPNTAITLSRKMMYGHKWECFKLQLTFLGWSILNILTMGILGIFYVNPYKEAVYSEYYTYIRYKAKKCKVENTQLLNDTYLFKTANKKTIKTAYSDIMVLMEEQEHYKERKRGKVWSFITNFFGVIPFYDKFEEDYCDEVDRKQTIASFQHIINGNSYPLRLCPIPQKEKKHKTSYLQYYRHYSISSLIIMFFIFCFVGWFWEVILHFIMDGKFINRGVLHGPWLPIYGTGGIMILVLLNKLRNKPFVLFLVTLGMCGVIEYFTGWYLESIYGYRWWDYTGYFLNINGLVCAEGLLIFGLGGLAVVYFIAPLLDNYIKKIPLKIIVPICIVLIMAICADNIYSHFVPNTGVGVTEYEEYQPSSSDNLK